MKLEEIFLSDAVRSTKRASARRFSYFPVVKYFCFSLLVGFLFGSSYYYGSNSNKSTMQKLDAKLDEFRKAIGDVSVAQERFKRDLVLENHVRAKRQAENNVVHTSDSHSDAYSPGGAAFIRWGRRDCEGTGSGTTIVYSGLAASNHYDYYGGGANFLCLDANVSYPLSKYRNGFQSASYIYGIHYYESSLRSLFDFSLIESRNFYQYNVPCSVCMAHERKNQMMIPGQDNCPGNWKKEYTGYIMGPSYTQKHTGQYICVDDRPQIVYGSDGSKNGERLYMVETECPSLQCGPYVNGRELRCIVCSL